MQHQTPSVGARVKLGIEGFVYSDLYNHERLADLGAAFDDFVRGNAPDLFTRFDLYRVAMRGGIEHGGRTEPEESELLIEVSRELGVFLAQLFSIEGDASQLRARAQRDAQVAKFKKEFVSKRVAK